MVNGKQKFAGVSRVKTEAYEKLMKAHKANKKVKAPPKEKEFTLFTWLDHWHNVYRLPKKGKQLSINTIKNDLCIIKKIKTIFKDCKLKELTADIVQQKLYKMTQGRTCEAVYTTLKLALDKARDRTGGISVMSLVEKVRHKRKRGRDLKNDEITTLLDACINDDERDVIQFYINTGCRVDEIHAVKAGHVNLGNEVRIITGLRHRSEPIPDMRLLPNDLRNKN